MSSTDRATRALLQGLFQLYPDEAAKFLNSLSEEEILRLLKNEPASTAVRVYTNLDRNLATKLLLLMDEDFFRSLFSTIDPARGVALLSRLDKDEAKSRLALLSNALAKEYRELMSYPPDSAGNFMDPKVTAFRTDDTVEEVMKSIRSIRDHRILDVCLVDSEGRLVAVVPLQNLALAQPNQRMKELVSGKPFTIHSMAPREDVVKLIEERKLASLPVTNLEGVLLGIIRYDALVSAVSQEVSEDVMTMFGAGKDERALSKASFAIRKRLPWLEINLVTAFLAAAVVGIFESTIAKITVLAVFLPVVAGQAGNTGSQALAVTMRGLIMREIRTRHWFKVARKELSTGFINGLAIALTTALVVYMWTSSIALSAVIGVAMVFSMVIAGLAGVVIPIVLNKFGFDPAQSSAIVLTTVTDVVGFMSFLGLATLLL
ncbi:magnesium transporter [Verrucomicrobiota bacterium]